MTSELKPCPFCGGVVELKNTIDGRSWWGVVCRNTENVGGTCAVEMRASSSKEAAVKRWNTRAPAKVGGDDMEQAWLKWINDARFYDWHNANECAQLHFAAGFDAAHAALSADGGEDKRDAERYRWLVERFVGYDFDWMPSEPDAADGASVAVFEIGREFRGSRDITASIDDHRAAKAKGDAS